MQDSPESKLSFDCYQRYRLAADVVVALQEGGPKWTRLLDAGSRVDCLQGFLPDLELSFVDREGGASEAGASGAGGREGGGSEGGAEDPRFLRGDVRQLPFADDSFDAVISLDLLEHIPPTDRQTVVAELARVARHGLILAFPTGDDVARVEQEVGQSLQAEDEQVEWLEEHVLFGLPDLDTVLTWVGDGFARTTTLPNGYLPRWAEMLVRTAAWARLPFDGGRNAQYLYNRMFYAWDNREPAYRKFVIGHNGSEQKLQRLVAPENAAVDELFTRFLESVQPVIEGFAGNMTELYQQLEQVVTAKNEQIENARSEMSQQQLAIEEKNRAIQWLSDENQVLKQREQERLQAEEAREQQRQSEGGGA